MTEPEPQLADLITVDNAHKLLAEVACPYCGQAGAFELFREPNNNGIGIACHGCGTRHPLRAQHIMWLRQGEKKPPKRSNNLTEVIAECGAYCYGCGTDIETLRRLGVGAHVHHTRPFAEHGEQFKKIPLCALCHELLSAVQRQMPKLTATAAALGEKKARQ